MINDLFFQSNSILEFSLFDRVEEHEEEEDIFPSLIHSGTQNKIDNFEITENSHQLYPYLEPKISLDAFNQINKNDNQNESEIESCGEEAESFLGHKRKSSNNESDKDISNKSSQKETKDFSDDKILQKKIKEGDNYKNKNIFRAMEEGYLKSRYNSMNSFHQTSLSFTGQNTGAKKMGRVQKVLWMCAVSVTVTGLVMGLAGWHFGRQLLSIYTDDPAVIEYGLRRMAVIFPTYFLCGLMEVVVGSLRGMGFSIMPMTVSLLGACGFRILWIMTVFAVYRTPEVLYASYPISWFITTAVHLICLFTVARRKYRVQSVS